MREDTIRVVVDSEDGRWELSISELLAEEVGELPDAGTRQANGSQTVRKTASLWGKVSDRHEH